DNLLPEEGQRTLLAADAKVQAADAFGLLAYYGAESAGALTLMLPNAAQLPVGGLKPLPDAELSARIKALPQATLARNAVKRMSLAGAQHKLP
ncbi:HipA N-terminal domain-containing protein, partial [Acinetobacter baumannii]